MQRLENVPPEEMNEVIRVATELHQQEQEADERAAESAEHARSAAAAAEEVGLPSEYLERAAEVVQERRIERVKRARKRRWAFAGLAAAAGLTALVVYNSFRPPLAEYMMVNPAKAFTLDKNAESVASWRVEGQAAIVKVEKFGESRFGNYWVNLNTTEPAGDLSGYRRVSFRVRGTGLESVRLFLENGNERWRSPAVPISISSTEHELQLSQFDYQTRTSTSREWRIQGKKQPGVVKNFSFKLGSFMNRANSKGEVEITSLRIPSD